MSHRRDMSGEAAPSRLSRSRLSAHAKEWAPLGEPLQGEPRFVAVRMETDGSLMALHAFAAAVVPGTYDFPLRGEPIDARALATMHVTDDLLGAFRFADRVEQYDPARMERLAAIALTEGMA